MFIGVEEKKKYFLCFLFVDYIFLEYLMFEDNSVGVNSSFEDEEVLK